MKPEILAPVGDMQMCQAAVFNGANAIYMGMPGFNARGRAPKLSLDELKEMIDFCHLHSVKVCLAFNVLLFEREIPDAILLLEDVLPLCPDAFIVQDIGLVRLIKYMAPDQDVHASTQMTVTNAEAIQFTDDLRISRYVLGREVSIPEMTRIKAETSKELEVFVHGALCVSYSGQCLTSERNGGRSANRGQCAQSCRLPYDLIVDDEAREMGERRYLVSPKDLCALGDVPRLMDAGIACFKIEGRLKSPEYVASTVRAYSDAVEEHSRTANVSDLARIYSRGFFNGWMDGVNHQKLVDGRYGNHHGFEAGEVLRVQGSQILISSSLKPSAGDGVVFSDFDLETEIGGNIFSVQPEGENYQLSFSREFAIAGVHKGMRVFLNSSPKIVELWRRTFTDRNVIPRIPIDMIISGEPGTALSLQVDDGAHTITEKTATNLLTADRAPLTEIFLRAELGALTGTPFELRSFKFEVGDASFIHQREIKQLRRRAIEKFIEIRTRRSSPTRRSAAEVQQWYEYPASAPKINDDSGQKPRLSVLLREQNQIEALSGLDLDFVYLDYEFGKEYQDSLAKVRSLGFKCGIATTRILKPGELGHLIQIRRLHPDAVLVRNLGAAEFFKNDTIPLYGDFSLNVTNSLTAGWLLGKGLSRLCPAYDLNREQLRDLIDSASGVPFEITVHQYMPEFHMEHCVFAAFLSKGTSYRDCGRPCEKHRVALRDPNGAIHPLKADAECRNSMFHGTPQSAARLIPELATLGVRHFRLEALYETPSELRTKLEIYLSLISGGDGFIDASSGALKRLGIVEKYGVSEGQLFNIRAHQDRTQKRGRASSQLR